MVQLGSALIVVLKCAVTVITIRDSLGAIAGGQQVVVMVVVNW
jgi:hypothetical protein